MPDLLWITPQYIFCFFHLYIKKSGRGLPHCSWKKNYRFQVDKPGLQKFALCQSWILQSSVTKRNSRVATCFKLALYLQRMIPFALTNGWTLMEHQWYKHPDFLSKTLDRLLASIMFPLPAMNLRLLTTLMLHVKGRMSVLKHCA